MDYVADLKNFVLAERAVAAIQFRVLGNIEAPVQVGLKNVEVRPNGIAIVNMEPDQALALAKEITKQAIMAKGRII